MTILGSLEFVGVDSYFSIHGLQSSYYFLPDLNDRNLIDFIRDPGCRESTIQLDDMDTRHMRHSRLLVLFLSLFCENQGVLEIAAFFVLFAFYYPSLAVVPSILCMIYAYAVCRVRGSLVLYFRLLWFGLVHDGWVLSPYHMTFFR